MLTLKPDKITGGRQVPKFPVMTFDDELPDFVVKRLTDIEFVVEGDHLDGLANSFNRGERIAVEHDGTRYFGYVVAISSNPLGGFYEVTVRPSGAPERMEKKMAKVDKKIRNRFYVAAPHVTTQSEQAQDNVADNVTLSTPKRGTEGTRTYGGRQDGQHTDGKWTRKTVDEAVAHAQEILEAQPGRDHVAIVRIIKIVRRKKAPIIVETV